MRKSIWNKAIPTYVALGLIIGGIFVTSFLVSRGVITVGRASAGITPQNVTVTNNTDTSFTISYSTTQPTIGTILYGKGGLLDKTQTEDTIAQTKETYSHSITVEGLQPKTTYEFVINSNGIEFKNQNANYTAQTGSTLDNQPPARPIQGIVLLEDGSEAVDTLVILSTTGSQTLSTKTNETGVYSFDISTLRSADLQEFFIPNENTEFKLIATMSGSSATAHVMLTDTNEIPTITLSNTYQFTTSETEENTATSASALQMLQENTNDGTVSIQTPAENATLTDARPQFKGTALPDNPVAISIGSISTETTADSIGVWTFRPQSSLPTGENTLIIESVDESDTVQTVERTFTILPSGSQVTQSATPSASLTPTTAIATPTTAILPTATPTLAASTPTSVIPTATPTPFITAAITYILPTPTLITKEPAPTGDTSTSIILTFGAVVSIITGALIFFVL
jgi:hypothetical protein